VKPLLDENLSMRLVPDLQARFPGGLGVLPSQPALDRRL